MTASKAAPLPPIHRTLLVSWPPDAAWRRFTSEFGSWWPKRTHSIGGGRVRRVVFEARVGGLIYEEHEDGTQFLWGKVTGLDAPRRVAFTWHPTKTEADAQDVEVTFTAEGTVTRVDLVSSGWERMGIEAARAYRGYRAGWAAVLGVFAGRFNPVMPLFTAFSVAIDLTGQRKRFIRESLGRVPGTGAAGHP